MKAELGNVKTGGFFLLYATGSIMNTTDEVREIEKNQIYWICLETGCGRVNHHKRAIFSRLKEFSLFVFIFWSFWMLSRPKFMFGSAKIIEIFENLKILIEKNQICWICLETVCGRVNRQNPPIFSRLKEFCFWFLHFGLFECYQDPWNIEYKLFYKIWYLQLNQSDENYSSFGAGRYFFTRSLIMLPRLNMCCMSAVEL